MRVACAIICLALAFMSSAQPDVSAPTPVTLQLNEAAPREIFEELSKQAGVEFSAPPQFWDKGPASISLDAQNQPFWLAMKDACGKAGVSLKYEAHAAQPRILLSRDNPTWTQYPSVATGPFLVSLIGLQRTSTVDMRKPNELVRSFVVRFSIFCEPRVRLLRGSLLARIEEAADDKGNSLLIHPTEKDAGDAMNFVTSWAYTLEGKLQYPKEAGTKIPVLRASANFVAQTQSETIDVPIDEPRAFKEVTRTVAGRKITFRELRRSSEEWEAVVTFARDWLPPEQWQKALFPGHTLRLIDGHGQSIAARGFGAGGKAEHAAFVFKFEKDGPKGPRIGKPVKLVWEVPTETRELPLSFEFKDVTLP